MKSVFAIDGGLEGYVCVLCGGKVLLSKTPTAAGKMTHSVLHINKDRETKDYRPVEMLRLVDAAIELDPNVNFVMEEPPSRIMGEGSGMHSILSQWRGYGMWNSVVSLRGRVLYVVASATWKAYFKISKKHKADATKADALGLAQKLYPNIEFPTIDSADACLVATYFRDNIDIEVVPRNARQKARK